MFNSKELSDATTQQLRILTRLLSGTTFMKTLLPHPYTGSGFYMQSHDCTCTHLIKDSACSMHHESYSLTHHHTSLQLSEYTFPACHRTNTDCSHASNTIVLLPFNRHNQQSPSAWNIVLMPTTTMQTNQQQQHAASQSFCKLYSYLSHLMLSLMGGIVVDQHT